MATVLYPDGSSKEVQPANGSDFKLRELQAIVGGHIEIVQTRAGKIMILDEEGKLKRLPRNEQATALVAFPTPEEIRARIAELEAHGVRVITDSGLLDKPDCICGTVLVCNNDEVR